MTSSPRVLVVGIDVARALRDAGFEAIDVGDASEPASIVAAAIDEDVDAICVGAGVGASVAAELGRHPVEIALVEVADAGSAAVAVRAAVR